MPRWLGAGETKLFLLHSNEVGSGAGLPASWVSVGTVEYPEQSLDISTVPRDK